MSGDMLRILHTYSRLGT